MMLGKAILNVFSELDETEINEFVEDYIADWSLSRTSLGVEFYCTIYAKNTLPASQLDWVILGVMINLMPT